MDVACAPRRAQANAGGTLPRMAKAQQTPVGDPVPHRRRVHRDRPPCGRHECGCPPRATPGSSAEQPPTEQRRRGPAGGWADGAARRRRQQRAAASAASSVVAVCPGRCGSGATGEAPGVTRRGRASLGRATKRPEPSLRSPPPPPPPPLAARVVYLARVLAPCAW